jgi:Pregnancy-associated plasma protein-A
MRFLLLLILLINTTTAYTQRNSIECGTKDNYIQAKMVDTALLQQRLASFSEAITQPYPVKVMVVVFADNNGSNVSATNADILRQFNNMRDFYAPHQICFILNGIEQVNNSNLNNMDTDTDIPGLTPYLYDNCITVFIHDSLYSTSDGSYNGIAYAIVNDYLSMYSGAIASNTNLSTLPHEMGHCFGLHHSFRARWDEVSEHYIRETRTRTGACKNCDTEGDLLCDTEADRNTFPSDIENCVYTGNETDSCGQPLLMAIRNIMTYGDRSCRNHFTNGQGSRSRSFLITTPMLTNTIAEDVFTVTTTGTYISGNRAYAARNSLTVNNGGNLSFTGSSKTVFASQEVTIKPNTTFSHVSSSGFVIIRADTPCN